MLGSIGGRRHQICLVGDASFYRPSSVTRYMSSLFFSLQPALFEPLLEIRAKTDHYLSLTRFQNALRYTWILEICPRRPHPRKRKLRMSTSPLLPCYGPMETPG